MQPFYSFVMAHIATGAVGLATFWLTVLTKKGGANHRRFGKIFASMMLATGAIAIAISICTLIAPIETHTHLGPELQDPALIRGIFGWMMLYLAILTINLAWYGWLAVSNKREHGRNLEWRNVALQAVVILAAANCAVQGWMIGQGLMIGISLVGFATAGTNLYFLYKPHRRSYDWLNEHIKALVGAGISVYTAFFAFGAVRLMPEMALNPVLWAVPLVTGLGLIIYHQRDVTRRFGGRKTLPVVEAAP
ncbi:MAG: hypothetical protein ACT4OU_01230 [Hyphomicrobium sp.]